MLLDGGSLDTTAAAAAQGSGSSGQRQQLWHLYMCGCAAKQARCNKHFSLLCANTAPFLLMARWYLIARWYHIHYFGISPCICPAAAGTATPHPPPLPMLTPAQQVPSMQLSCFDSSTHPLLCYVQPVVASNGDHEVHQVQTRHCLSHRVLYLQTQRRGWDATNTCMCQYIDKT